MDVTFFAPEPGEVTSHTSAQHRIDHLDRRTYFGRLSRTKRAARPTKAEKRG